MTIGSISTYSPMLNQQRPYAASLGPPTCPLPFPALPYSDQFGSAALDRKWHLDRYE